MISCNSESTLNDKDPERLLQSESCNVYLRNDKVGLMSRTNGNGMFRFFLLLFLLWNVPLYGTQSIFYFSQILFHGLQI